MSYEIVAHVASQFHREGTFYVMQGVRVVKTDMSADVAERLVDNLDRFVLSMGLGQSVEVIPNWGSPVVMPAMNFGPQRAEAYELGWRVLEAL